MMKQTLLILILALCTSLASLSLTGGSHSDPSEVEKKIVQHAEQLSKDIKEHAFRLQMELFELNKLLGSHSGPVNEFIEARVKEHDARAAELEVRQEEIQKAREEYIAQSKLSGEHHKNLQYAIMWMQGAIMVVGLANLTQKRALWYVGVLSALAGIGYLANGYLLWI